MFVRFKGWLAAIFCTLWVKSLRIRLRLPEGYGPGVVGSWHQDLLASCAAFRRLGMHILVSESSDGDLFARVASRLGYRVTRGSDTHGALNVRHLVRTLREGGFVGMALDGPRGPALQVKPGSLWLAEKSGRPLWLTAVRYGRHIRLKSWDNFVVPFPLTSIDIEIKYFCPEDKSTPSGKKE